MGNWWNFKCFVTLTLTLHRVKVISVCTIPVGLPACPLPNHLTVASRSTEIWLFEFREISTLREVWTVMIAFLEAHSKIWLWQAIDQIPYDHQQQSVLSSTQMEMWSYGQLSEVHMLHDLELDLGSGQGHINIHSTCRTTSMPTHQIRSKSEKLLWTYGWTYVHMYGWTNKPEFQSTRSSVSDDLKINRFWQMIPNN